MSPETWEDRNDAYFLERYRDERRCRSVLAICFSTNNETFHHWRIFAHGGAGVCIEFNRQSLLKSFEGVKGFSKREVVYKWIGDLQNNPPMLEDWPFLKRKSFEAESEYRVVFETKTESLRAKSVEFDLTSIQRVTLSPWLPESISSSIIEIIQKIDGCSGLKVERSSLLDNTGWRDIVK